MRKGKEVRGAKIMPEVPMIIRSASECLESVGQCQNVYIRSSGMVVKSVRQCHITLDST